MRPQVWVVEEKVRSRYWPVFAHSKRFIAEGELREFRIGYKRNKFRLVQYVRKKQAKEEPK